MLQIVNFLITFLLGAAIAGLAFVGLVPLQPMIDIEQIVAATFTYAVVALGTVIILLVLRAILLAMGAPWGHHTADVGKGIK